MTHSRTLLADRAVIRLSPTDGEEDVAAFLQGLVTNDVTGDLPVYGGLLNAQGKAIASFFVWREGDDLLLDCEAVVAAELVKRLSLYRLRRKIGIAVDESIAVHWAREGADGAVDPRLPALGHRWLGAREGEDASDDYRAHRLSHGVPESVEEIGDLLWLETNAGELSGVSFTKGCFIGQENTARMNWRQKVNRRLVVVPLGESDGKRQRVSYPALDLAVDHLRVSDIPSGHVPDWLDLG
ncbi:CAF17-like 4Fe-4S cluster assembly/insertion protein YgfZ [Pseudoblastomonas halimionae]|uniref:Folate-binding protein n=1 Tax=Alteriqipengyuania halimionae TaxID=1926630 RepID=A0A6I4TYN4_9SPHN|nr:folate-binding protein YgfZ [Alteriqipengyuania halimionae]MXP08728.1 folate-binding protein [Alteriqipengyuania halimionae]